MVVVIVGLRWLARGWCSSVVGLVAVVPFAVLVIFRDRLGRFLLPMWCCNVVWSVARLSIVCCPNVVVVVVCRCLCAWCVGVCCVCRVWLVEEPRAHAREVMVVVCEV